MICIFDPSRWMLRLPDRAEIFDVTVSGPMIFLSVDISDVPRAERIMFDHIEPGTPPQLPPGKPTAFKPGGGPQA